MTAFSIDDRFPVEARLVNDIDHVMRHIKRMMHDASLCSDHYAHGEFHETIEKLVNVRDRIIDDVMGRQ